MTRKVLAQDGGPYPWYDPATESEVRLVPLPLRAGKSLLELQPEFAFLALRLLYLYGGFTNRFLQDFASEHPKETFWLYQSKHPMFQGLEAGHDPAWNYHLFAVSRRIWPTFSAFMLSIAVIDREQKILVKAGEQLVEIADPVVLDRQLGSVLPARPDLVTIAAFGVNGTKGAVAFGAGKHPIADPPKATFHEPQEDHLVYANAFWAKENPHDAVTKWRLERDATKTDTP